MARCSIKDAKLKIDNYLDIIFGDLFANATTLSDYENIYNTNENKLLKYCHDRLAFDYECLGIYKDKVINGDVWDSCVELTCVFDEYYYCWDYKGFYNFQYFTISIVSDGFNLAFEVNVKSSSDGMISKTRYDYQQKLKNYIVEQIMNKYNIGFVGDFENNDIDIIRTHCK